MQKPTIATLRNLRSDDLKHELQVMDRCALLYCRQGSATLGVNYQTREIVADTTFNLFPADIIAWQGVSSDLQIEVLSYDEALLREASMNIEHSIYDSLRRRRSCTIAEVVRGQVAPMFQILSYYATIASPQGWREVVLQQLKTFFWGFHDHLLRHPESTSMRHVTPRTEELFGRFMELMEHEYEQSREVSYYASRLCITRKYLGLIVKEKTGKTAKDLIDEYVILQLKLALRATQDSVKQISQQFHFSDQSFMVRYFRAHTGRTPADYRRMVESHTTQSTD